MAKHEDNHTMAGGSGDLMAGIEDDARHEAERIVADARKTAERRQRSTDSQVADVLEAAERKAAEQEASILQQARASGTMEARRIALRTRERVMEQVTDRARAELAAMIDTPAYRAILRGWLVEACIGLNEPEAVVNASASERPLLDRALLDNVAAEVKALTGRTVALEPATGDPRVPQGVVVTATAGRIAFNNDITTRLLRYQSEIRRMVYGEIFDN